MQVPPLVIEFADKVRKLTSLYGTIRRDMNNTKMVFFNRGPMMMLTVGETAEEVYVSLGTGDGSVPILNWTRTGISFDERVLEKHLPEVSRWLVLDALSEL
ncbi:MAG: hypothetical protein AB7L09_01775 [Nitrospira sp.]